MTDTEHLTFTRFFTEYRDALQRYVRRLVGSRETADELVQEAFLRTYVRRDAVRMPKAFLFATAHNLAVKLLRSRHVAATDSVSNLDELAVHDPGQLMEDQLIADEELRFLREAIGKLSPQRRTVFVLRIFHSCSYRDIAEKLGISEKTVEKHIAQAALETHSRLRKRYQNGGQHRA